MLRSYLFFAIVILFSCSSDDDPGTDLGELVIGTWQLDRIDIQGADCQAIFGSDVPTSYAADMDGCARPTEVLGNAQRCILMELRANGEGTFLWSAISGGPDAPITYTIENDELEYCFEPFSCGGPFKLVGTTLQSETDLRIDQVCKSIFVLTKQ